MAIGLGLSSGFLTSRPVFGMFFDKAELLTGIIVVPFVTAAIQGPTNQPPADLDLISLDCCLLPIYYGDERFLLAKEGALQSISLI